MKYTLIASAVLLALAAIAAGVGTASAQSTAPATPASRPATSNRALALQIEVVNEGSTTTRRLQVAQTYLTRVVAALDATPNDLSGGHAAKAKAYANQTLDDIKAALAYVHDHPEIDRLQPSQHPLPGTGNGHPGNVPAYARTAFSSPTKEISGTIGSVDANGAFSGNKAVAFGPMDANGIRIDQDGTGVSVYLASAMQNLVNAWGLFTGSKGSVGSGMSDIGGFRTKIWDDMTNASAESLAGLDFIHDHTIGTPVKPTFAGPGVRATAETATSQLASASPPAPQPTGGDTLGVRQGRPAEGQPSAHVLEATYQQLQKALDLMQKTSAANKGGFIEKSIADLQKALSDTADGIDYAKTHPDPETPSTTEDVGIDDSAIAGGLPAPNPRAALKNLKSALADVQYMPAADPGGYRHKIIADIIQAAADTISSITFGGTPQTGTPARGRNGRNGRGRAGIGG